MTVSLAKPLRERYARSLAGMKSARQKAAGISDWRWTTAALCAMPSVAYAVTFPIARALGEAPLLLAVAGTLGSVMALGRVIAPLPQILMSVTATVYLALSLTGNIDTAWTIFFDAKAAVRQWSWVIMVPLFATAFYAFIVRYGDFIWRRALVLAVAWYALSRAGLFIFRPPTWNWDIVLYGVSNINLPLLCLLYIAALTRPTPIARDLGLIAGVAAVSATMTHMLTALSTLVIRCVPWFRYIPAMLGVLLIAALLAAPHFALEAYRIDGNTGVRAVMWQDATDAMVQTNGVGVGFGTEYIRNDFSSVEYGWILMDARDPARMFISTHSAFYDVGIRLGLPGIALFILWMARYAVVPSWLTTRNARLSAALTIQLYCSLAVNPGLVSTNIFIGIAMILAMLEVLRAGYDFNRREEEPQPTRFWRQDRFRNVARPLGAASPYSNFQREA